jgi:mono/diheme cytochrome c family protein
MNRYAGLSFDRRFKSPGLVGTELLLAATAAWAFALSGCGGGESAPKREWTPADHGQPAQAAPERVPQPSAAADGDATGEPPTLRAARALWVASCAGCHGRDGRGQGDARPPGAQLPDLGSVAFQNGRTDRQFATVIREGRGMMPAFGKQLTEQGITALVQYVRTLGSPAPDAGAHGANAPRDAPPDAPQE